MLDVRCCIEREHDAKAGRGSSAGIRTTCGAVVADNDFQEWYLEHGLAAYDLDGVPCSSSWIETNGCSTQRT